MSRSLSRRLCVLTALGGVLAVASSPALADHATNHSDSEPITVSITATDTVRQFAVLEKGADTALTRLDFGSTNREMPFRVRVRDQEHSLNGGFQVTTKMTNLYLKNADGSASPYDHSTMIQSKYIGLGYSANPLEALGVNAIVAPQLSVTGLIKDCTDPAVQDVLGIVVPLGSTIEATLALLSGTQDRVCDALAGGATVAEAFEAPLDTVNLAVSNALSVADLPINLSGAQQGGAFTNPAYGGGIAPSAPSDAPAATSHQMMSGTPGVTSALSKIVNGLLATETPDVLDRVSTKELLEGLRENAALSTIVTGLEDAGLTDAQRDALLANLTGTLTDLLPISVPKVSGDYVAHPVLKVNPVTTKPGVYEGTLTVDFFDGL